MGAGEAGAGSEVDAGALVSGTFPGSWVTAERAIRKKEALTRRNTVEITSSSPRSVTGKMGFFSALRL
jgi:hypothetical protein